MDEMRIVSKFTRGVISKIVEQLIRTHTAGCNADVQLNELTVTIDDGRPHLHLDVDVELSKEDFTYLLNSFI